MSEYEIFNNDNQIEVIPETKKQKRQKRTVIKTDKDREYSKFFTEVFNLESIPVVLSLAAIFFSMFVRFLSIFSMIAAIVLFFIGAIIAFASLIIEIINIIKFKDKKFEFNLKTFLIILSFFVLFI